MLFVIGNFAAPLVAHMFCNYMGFPDVREIFGYTGFGRVLLLSAHLAGAVAWYSLLFKLTEPEIFSNTLYNII